VTLRATLRGRFMAGTVAVVRISAPVRSSQNVQRVRLKDLIRDIPDFPKPGIVFKDITPLLRDPGALSLSIEYLTSPFLNDAVDLATGAESRGFIFATAVARHLSAGFIPIRKPGKLPYSVRRSEYELEYGTDALEIHVDAIKKGDRVLLVDDVLATGGTMSACIDLVKGLGGVVVGAAFLIELKALNGREKLGDIPIHSVLEY
jgi:adenine phosphoribosyltransferase